MPERLCAMELFDAGRAAVVGSRVITLLRSALRGYPRRSPVTAGYLVVLLLVHLWLDHAAGSRTAAAVLAGVSTNLDNLAHDPIGVLLGSALFIDGPLTPAFSLDYGATLITLVLGVGCALAWLEHRVGAVRAWTVFAAGHVGATLLTAGVIICGIDAGWYPASLRHTLDFGISYGAQAALAAVTFALHRRLRPWWALCVLAWPLAGWAASGTLVPDFTTVGHLIAAAIGFPLGAWLLAPARAGQRRGGGESGPGGRGTACGAETSERSLRWRGSGTAAQFSSRSRTVL